MMSMLASRWKHILRWASDRSITEAHEGFCPTARLCACEFGHCGDEKASNRNSCSVAVVYSAWWMGVELQPPVRTVKLSFQGHLSHSWQNSLVLCDPTLKRSALTFLLDHRYTNFFHSTDLFWNMAELVWCDIYIVHSTNWKTRCGLYP